MLSSFLWKIYYHEKQTVIVWFVLIALYIVGLGFFQANAIQFGLDQLLEAPTSKLIAFIHWYYWAQNVGGLLLFYIAHSTFSVLNEANSITNKTITKTMKGMSTNIVYIALLIAITVVLTAVLILFCTTKKRFYIQKAGLNPFKNIYKVLKYSWKHKIPEHRSAFTYWEEDIPHRIDLGKNKYGGPFTNEEVEDAKTFLRILPLLLCLFGYHLAGDGYSAPEQLQRTSCPSLPVLLLIVINPLHMSTLVAVVGIPLYRLVIVKVIPRLKNVRMLTKMWIGLYFHRLIIPLLSIFVQTPEHYYGITACLFMVILLLHIFLQPHKQKWHNLLELSLFINIMFLLMISLYNYYIPDGIRLINVQLFLMSLSFAYIVVYTAVKIHQKYPIIKKCGQNSSAIDTDMSNDFPYRLLNDSNDDSN